MEPSATITGDKTKFTGYLGAFFLGDVPSVYFYLSDGNDPLSLRALNGGSPVLVPRVGTGGVRDPSIIKAKGEDRWFIIGTDLDFSKHTSWDSAQRNCSLSVYVWESTDLINWGTERLVKVENDNAGMVWAPDAIWDNAKGQYLVHWASRFYSPLDSNQTGEGAASKIRYAYTSDFVTFTPPQTFIDESPDSIIDLAILDLGSDRYVRFLKKDDNSTVYMERSENGLFGTWIRDGGKDGYIRREVEGPYAFESNSSPGKYILLLDFMDDGGYRPFTTSDPDLKNWAEAESTHFPPNLRHGSMIGITQKHYDLLEQATWG